MLLNEQTAVQLGDKKVLGVRQGDKFILGRHNLVPNGQGRYTSGTVEVRRNLQSVPRSTASQAVVSLISDLAGWGGAAATRSQVADSSAPSGGGYVTRLTNAQAVTSVQGWLWTTVSDRPTVTPGLPYALSVWVRSSFAVQARIAVTWKNADNTAIVSGGNGTFSSLPAGEWTRLGAVFTAPTGAGIVYMSVGVAEGFAIPAGATFDSDAALTEQATQVGDYFDGDSSPDPDLTPSWTGAANASASVLNGVVSTTVIGMHDKSINVQSQAWPIGGTSIRVIPRTANNDCFAEPGGGGGGLRLGLVTGKPVAIKAVGHLFKIQQGTLSNAARRVALGIKVDGVYSFVLGSQMPNEIGDFSSEVSTTIPANAAGAFVRLYNGASVGNGEIYWTDVRVCQADTEEEALRLVRAPYRDGDFPGWTWDGTPGQSASRGLS